MIGSRQHLASDAPTPRRSPLRRLVAIVLLLLLVLVLLVAGFLLLVRQRMQATVPVMDGTVHVPGLQGAVVVRRDAHGVPHIVANNMHDLLFAQAYVMASDRLWQMDMARRLPEGEAAEVLGSGLTERDKMERILGLRDVAQRMVRTMPADELANMQAYADGVNAFIAHHSLPAEFLLLHYSPKPWTPMDSMVVGISMSQTLDQRWPQKLRREQVTALLNEHGAGALVNDLFPVGSWRDHPPVPSQPGISDPQVIEQIPLDPSQIGAVLPQAGRDALLALTHVTNACPGCQPGSNEWAVSGAHTATGKPLLSNDMHLEHQIPDAWYENDLQAGSFHATGVSVPGVPYVVAGHNDHISWGFTALGGDTQDVYVEQTDRVGQYHTLNADGTSTGHPIQHEHEIVHVRGGRDVELDIQRTAHGPIITSLIPGERRVISLKWSLYDQRASGLPLFALDKAADWNSFRAAFSTWWGPSLNVAYADDAGHIGYQAVGLIPVRAGGLQFGPITPKAPVAMAPAPPPDLSSLSAMAGQAAQQTAQVAPAAPPAVVGEWTGFIPFDAMPSVLDPEGGIVATANARITPDNSSYQVSLDWADPYRNERIWKWLGSHQALTPESMLHLQTDVFSEVDQALAQRFAYAVDHTKNADPRARAAADLLRSWDGEVTGDSAPAAILTSVLGRFWPAVLGAKIGDGWKLYDWGESAYAREELITKQPAAWLPPTYRSWNECLTVLLTEATADGPKNLAKWRYSELHTIGIRHPLWGNLPPFRKYGSVGPLPEGGDGTTVKQVSKNLGPSQRFTADMSNLDHSTENLVVGQSGNPKSPYFRDQWPLWYSGKTFELPWSASAVESATQHTLNLVP